MNEQQYERKADIAARLQCFSHDAQMLMDSPFATRFVELLQINTTFKLLQLPQ